MKEFFKFMFASMLGTFIILVITFFLFLGMIVSLATFADKKTVSIEANSVLHIKLDKPVYDRAPKDRFNFFMPSGLDFEKVPGLNEILDNIKKAESDPNVKGIFLDLSLIPSGFSTVREIRGALSDFKSSGKFIVAYGEIYTQMAYYLASVADEIYLHPHGGIEFKGLAAELFFIKGTLEKLDIDVQVIRHGKYKSAGELLMYDKMSPSNREQLDALISDLWETMTTDIARDRNLSTEHLNTVADKLDALEAEKALSYELVDGLYHKDQLLAALKEKLGIEEKAKIQTVSLAKYTQTPDPSKSKVHKDKIAVVYAIGNIIDGKGDDLTIGSAKMSEAIRRARKNDKVKAIVLRVNSPGGSATASEVIRREVALAAKIKPVVVSMGDVAASGGYWISAPANKIFADPATITGSIGVFGAFPNMQQFFNKKLGITFDHTLTNKYADFPNVTRPLTDYETIMIERMIDKIYQDFLTLVSEGRGMGTEQVDAIGQGRVWSGTDALEIGLIDQFGGLQDAIAAAAELAEITEYNLWSLPAQKDPFQQLFDELTGNVSAQRLEKELGDFYTYYQHIKYLSEMKGIQARLPFEIRIF